MRMPSTDLCFVHPVSDTRTRNRWQRCAAVHGRAHVALAARGHQFRVTPYETAPPAPGAQGDFAPARVQDDAAQSLLGEVLARGRQRRLLSRGIPVAMSLAQVAAWAALYQPTAAPPHVSTAGAV